MFDIGSPELLVVAVTALLVLGPERLPGVMRELARWWGRLARRLSSTRKQIEEEIGFDQIRRQLAEEQAIAEIKATKIELDALADDLELGTVGPDLKELQKPETASSDPTHWPGMPPTGAD
ncbi:MAG: Sec-independent protein translocase protein TatB [Pseudomonadales bacterium]|nr:Sec-independent protein translocase protein TatB [Pseudomonadales bacterium]MDP6826548.1 Sec-independent protein translocase protein TatB [Pseudomonadales bacterium]MDP6970356.1 Sec-independent protein translocase protein TatB [Pseudomonadales bacterium]